MSLDLILSNNPLILKFFQQLYLKLYFTKPGLNHIAEFLIASSQAAFSGKVCNITHLSCLNKHRTSFGHFLSHGAWQSAMVWKCIQKFGWPSSSLSAYITKLMPYAILDILAKV